MRPCAAQHIPWSGPQILTFEKKITLSVVFSKVWMLQKKAKSLNRKQVLSDFPSSMKHYVSKDAFPSYGV
jgi:hypothetical protein